MRKQNYYKEGEHVCRIIKANVLLLAVQLNICYINCINMTLQPSKDRNTCTGP